MKSTFIRNSFVAPRNLAFSDKALEASRKGARAGSISFSYNHGAPSYPADVLADGACRGYIEPLGDGSDPELQKFVVTTSGNVDDQAVISVSGGGSYSSPSGAGVAINGSMDVVGAGYHSVSVVHINIAYPPKSNVSYINCTLSGISKADPVPDKNDREITCKDSCSCSIEGWRRRTAAVPTVPAGRRRAKFMLK